MQNCVGKHFESPVRWYPLCTATSPPALPSVLSPLTAPSRAVAPAAKPKLRIILNQVNSRAFQSCDPSCEFGPNYNWISCQSFGQLYSKIISSLLAFLGSVLDRYIKYMMWYITWRDIQLLFCFYAKLAQTSNVLINLEKNYFYTST